MAESTRLGVAQVPVRATLDELDKDLEGARKKIDTAMSKAQGMIDKSLGKVLKAGAAGLLGVTAAAGGALGKLATDALPLQGISDAFAGITGDAGAMLDRLREGSAGMVRDVELMRNYNDAAQLVNKAFADQLPEAMQYLMKISAATGDSMDYLMSSLVKGVGRVQPLILDNLKIQVSESEITARATAMYGKKKEALSKVELQTATMNVVLEKLAANTAAMPDVIGTNVQRWGQLRTMLQNTKDMAGLMLQPALAAVLSVLVPIGERIQSSVVPAMMVLNQAIVNAVGRAQELWQASEGVRVRLADMAAVIAANAGPILAGLAVTITSIVIPSLLRMAATAVTSAMTTITALLPIVGPALAIGVAVGLLYAAWQNNWFGIRDTLTAVWENTLRPELDTMATWLQVNVPRAIAALTSFWNDKLLPALQSVWKFITVDLQPVFEGLANVGLAVVTKASEALAGLWQNVLEPALTKYLIPAFQDAKKAAENDLGKTLNWLREKVVDPVTKSFDGMSGAIERVKGWLDNLAQRISSLKLPSWLTPGSPTPFEIALRGIADAMGALAGDKLPQFKGALGDLAGVLSDVRSIFESLSTELPTSKVSISSMFAALKAILDEAATWATGQTLAPLIKVLTDHVGPELEALKKALDPMVGLFQGVRTAMDLLSQKALPVATSVETFLSYLKGIVVGFAKRFEVEPGLVALFDWFDKDFRPMLERWVAAIRPAIDLLGLAKNAMDLLGDKAKSTQTSVGALFSGLMGLMWAAGDFLHNADSGQGAWLKHLIDWFGTFVTPVLARWTEVLQPLQAIMSVATGLLDIVADAEKDMLYGVDAMFANLWSLLDLVDSSLAKVSGPIDTILASWGTADDPASITGTFVRWAATLKPLQDVLSTTKGLLDVVADAEKDMLYGVDAMFANLWSLIEAVQTYMAGPGRQAIDDIIATFGDPTKEGSLAYTFGKWAAALKPLQDVMSTAKGLLDLASEKVKDIKLDIGKFFNLAIDMGRQVASYAQLNAKAIDAATAEMEAQRPRLEGFRDALKPVADLVKQITDFIANAFKLAEGEVDMAFNQRLIPTIRNLRLGMNNLYDALVGMDVSFLPDLRTKVATLHDSLRDILGIIVSMVGAKEQEGVEATVLTEFAEAIKRGLMGPTNSAKAHFDAFYSFLDVTFRANVAALDFAPAIAACIRTITDKLSEVESAVYDGGYSVGEQIGQGIADGLAAMRLTVDGAAVSLAQAAIVAAKRELGIASPSAVAAREVGQPFGVGIMVGIDRAIGQLNGALSGSMNQLVAQAAAGTNVTNTRTVTLNVTQNRLDDPRSLRDMVRLMEYSY